MSLAAQETEAPQRPAAPPRSRGELAMVWVVWLVYGVFYFCRTNLSAANTGLMLPLAEGGLALTKEQLGYIAGAGKVSYGVGQLFNGQLAEFISPRKLLALGMLASAALNVAFGFGASFLSLWILWAANGYFQSLGWTPCVRVVGNWVPAARRGKAIGIIGTGYQVTLGLTYLVAGWGAAHFGWRGAVFLPAAILAAGAVFMLAFLKDSPATVSTAHTQSTTNAAIDKKPILTTIALTLSNPALWLLGAALGLLNACRYGFVDWGITHLVEVQNARIDKAAYTYVVFAAGAVAGSFLTGWATDRFFGGRRAPALCALLVLLGVFTLIYERLAAVSPAATALLLVAIGFCVFGPQVLLVGTAPADLARRGTPAAAAGFVNFMGYMGAAAGDVVTGHYLQHGGWQIAIRIWAAWAFGAALIVALLWNARARTE